MFPREKYINCGNIQSRSEGLIDPLPLEIRSIIPLCIEADDTSAPLEPFQSRNTLETQSAFCITTAMETPSVPIGFVPVKAGEVLTLGNGMKLRIQEDGSRTGTVSPMSSRPNQRP